MKPGEDIKPQDLLDIFYQLPPKDKYNNALLWLYEMDNLNSAIYGVLSQNFI